VAGHELWGLLASIEEPLGFKMSTRKDDEDDEEDTDSLRKEKVSVDQRPFKARKLFYDQVGFLSFFQPAASHI